jgi:hypothetical protein
VESKFKNRHDTHASKCKNDNIKFLKRHESGREAIWEEKGNYQEGEVGQKRIMGE